MIDNTINKGKTTKEIIQVWRDEMKNERASKNIKGTLYEKEIEHYHCCAFVIRLCLLLWSWFDPSNRRGDIRFSSIGKAGSNNGLYFCFKFR